MVKEKQQSDHVIKRGMRYAKGYNVPVIIAILFAIISSILTVIGPDKLREMADIITHGIMTGINLEQVNSIGMTLVIMYGFGAILGYSQTFIIATVSQRFTERLRNEIAKKMNRLPLRYFDSRATGDVLSIITNDLDTVGQSLNQSLGGLVSATILLLGSLVMMFKTNWIMTLTAIFSMIVGFVGMSIIMGRSIDYFKAQQANVAGVNGYVEEAYSGLQIVTSYNANYQMKAEFDKLNNKLYDSAWKSQFLSGIMIPFMTFIGNFGYVMVCVVGAILVINGDITVGVIIAFMVYVRLFSQPLAQIAQSAQSLQSAQAALGRVMDYLDAEEMEDESAKASLLDEVKGEVVFDHVKFGYDEEKVIIHDFNAVAKAGQKVAIVGPTGAGKTTIVNLLMRFYELNGGKISIDGKNISEMSREELHEEFSMVLQDTWLFEGSIRQNLIFNQHDISQEAVEQAAKSVGIHHFIMTLPHGYDTVLDDTLTLSVGQKQLLTIARALIKDAPLLILDEATSSVDTRTEELIQRAMDELMKGRTSFVIAHRLSTIRNADLILVMREGNIIEQGNHEALMAQNGFYADLYNSQFETGSFDEEAM